TAALVSLANTAHAEESSLFYGPFGRVALYQGQSQPSRVILFVSGDGGWNLGVVDMARELAKQDALVIGIDIIRYLRNLEKSPGSCSYPAADFEELSKYVQRRLHLPTYQVPLLVGYSSGATLVYALLVQAPPNTFAGAVSMGFCPDLPLVKPLCRGRALEWTTGPRGKGYSFLPVSKFPIPWVALQGTIDQVCNAVATEAYIHKVNGGRIILLPKVGHGFSVPKNWFPQFTEAIRSFPATAGTTSREELKDLPLVEVAATSSATDALAVIVSGDGGWAGIDRDVADELARKGIPVVGLNSLQYFWRGRTPEEAARDMRRILYYYSAKWNKKKTILIGYSLGADVLPFMVSRLPGEALVPVTLMVLLGPSREAAFEFHLSDWLGTGSEDSRYPVLPEIRKIHVGTILCFCGEEESGSPCRGLKAPNAQTIILPGGHHFGGDYERIANIILQEASRAAPD
ncbi:MAG: hypothetical protein PHY31_04265, partial [Smithellaceae bacterium]|nr:hypothetical protein [Smithellaceae bacterium]